MTIPNRVLTQGIWALLFAVTVEMNRQAIQQLDPGYPAPRGSTALAVALKLLVAHALEGTTP